MFLFFKWVRISPEMDCYQGANPASNIDEDPYEVKCHIKAQCAPPPKNLLALEPNLYHEMLKRCEEKYLLIFLVQ